MLLHIRTGYYEVWEVNPTSLSSVSESPCFTPDRYNKYRDEKWRRFCKEHHFHPIEDANNKIYRLYLDLCAEGLY